MNKMPFVRVLAVGCGLALVAGCAGSSSPRGGGQSATPSKRSIASPATPASKALLSQIVLQRSELPGWTATPAKDDPGSAQDQRTLMSCTGARNTDSDKVADAHSQDYSLDQAHISSDATSYRSRSDIDSDTALLRNPKFAPCYQKLVKTGLAKELPAGATLQSVSLHITPGPGAGPANVAGTVTGQFTVSAGGNSLVLYIDATFITGPMIEAEIDSENLGAPVPATLWHKLVQSVAARAARG